MHAFRIFIATTAAVALSASIALGVKPETWTHEEPKQFTAGKLDDVVVSSLGEVTLGRDVRSLGEVKDKADVINALARAGDGAVYAATGPGGIIFRILGDEVTEFTKLPPEAGSIFSLVFDSSGKLLAGTGGGDQARIYRIDGAGKYTVFYEPEDAVYVWALARAADGRIYAATGTEGQIHVIEPDGGSGKVLADLKTKNILCMALGSNGQIYVGTDENGLVCRIDPKTGKPFVLYDAKEPEISALVLDADGNVFASTAAPSAAKPGLSIADKPGGRPDNAESKPADAEEENNANDNNGKNNGDGDDQADKDGEEGKGQSNELKEAEKIAEAMIEEASKMIGRAVSAPNVPKEGNAIYRIATNGFVTQVFREPVMILAMAEADGTIYAATGNEGRIYAVSPAQDRSTMIAKLEPKQATAVLRLDGGKLMVGTANFAGLYTVSGDYAKKGTLTSEVLDAEQVVKWGTVQWKATVPEGTKLTIATRTSNVEDEESEAWEDWSEPFDATTPRQIPSTTARFLQYRLTFETTDVDRTPTLRQLGVTRIEANRAPQVLGLEVASARLMSEKPGAPAKIKSLVGSMGGEKPGPDYYFVARWKAEDPNKDTLVFDVFYRRTDARKWIRIGEEIEEPLHAWDTRTMAEGKYEIRVLASDVRDNPPGTELTGARVSDPFVVDNTPPELSIDKAVAESGDSVRISGTMTDALSDIASAEFSVDSDEEWRPIAAADDIFDSPKEKVSFVIKDLEPGEHRIAIRTADAQGNVRYVSYPITIGD